MSGTSEDKERVYAENELILHAQSLIPQLCPDLHKGSCGRVLVVGGSEAYTGAPYFAAISALRCGADLAYVICEPQAALAIKSYSPELIVWPYLDDGPLERIEPILNKIDCAVIGPGLGANRKGPAHQVALFVARRLQEKSVPVVLDADALRILMANKGLFCENPSRVFVTPNAHEFHILSRDLLPPELLDNGTQSYRPQDLCAALSGATLICKGSIDKLITCAGVAECSQISGQRRYGGQGDILAGILGSFLAFMRYKPAALDDPKTRLALACAACSITRLAGYMAYKKHLRATSAPAHIDEVGPAFEAFRLIN